MNPGGAMTGGSQQKKALHVFGRSREIRSLQEALQTANRTIAEMRDRLALANEDLQEIEQETVEKKMELQRVMVTQRKKHWRRSRRLPKSFPFWSWRKSS